MKYCKQDVVVTTEIFKKVEKYIPEMKNLKAFDDNQLNFLRNNQGIRFNLKRVKQLSNIVEKLKVKYKERAKMLVGDSNFNLNSDVQIKKVLKDFKLENTQAQSLKPLYPKLKPNIQKLILLRLNRPSGVSSVLNKTLSNSDKDGVVRNSIRFWGAGQTSRFTSYGVNPLTWPRLSGDSQKDIDFIKDKNKFYGKELHRSFSAVKNVMRRSIIPHKNCVFYGGDFSQIEFRLLMLCCGDLKRLKMLYNGWDCYKFLASKVYDIAIEKVTTQQRYIAKRVTLAKGYGMGVLKAQNILWAEGVFVSEDVVRSVFKAYDSSFPQVIKFSINLENNFNGKYLKIPYSGRRIHLFNCKRMVGEYGPYWTFKNKKGHNEALPKHRMTGWVIQSLACDIFKNVLRNLYCELGLVTDIPFHDEVVCSVPLERGKPSISFKDFKRVLGTSPAFIKKHLPYIQTETWKGGFYAK